MTRKSDSFYICPSVKVSQSPGREILVLHREQNILWIVLDSRALWAILTEHR